MAQNEKIRTEDVIEVKDSKILALSDHPNLSILAGENYDSVLNKISSQSLSAAEKDALDNTLTTPSATNPVVLKDDLATYIPEADLGEVKDTVPTLLDLPVAPNNTYGDLRAVVSERAIYRWTGTTFTFDPVDVDISLDLITKAGHGMSDGQIITLSTANTLPSPLLPHTFYYVVNSTLTTFQLSLTLGGLAIDLLTVGLGTHRVMYLGYWNYFIQTGTLDHTELLNQNGSSSYQHLTSAEKLALLTATHSHTNKTVLDAIVLAGSGQIITNTERSLLPTPDQKAALVGTSGTPNAVNPYVTNNDPRLNTVRNPYVTVGPPGSLASFQGVDYIPFQNALIAIDTGSASSVKAIEVLPGFYTLGGVFLQWSTQASALVLEAWTPGSVTLSLQTFQEGIQALDPLTLMGPLIIRGFTFEFNGAGTSGILSQRTNTLIEDCTFRPGPFTAANQVGIVLQGENSIVRRCHFEGSLAKGIDIQAEGCRVEECTFNITSTNPAVQVNSSYALIDHCNFISGIAEVTSGIEFTGLYNNWFDPTNSSITDSGLVTRYIENQPQEVNQPYVAGIRTVGPTGTYADYRGLTDVSIRAALTDAKCYEVVLLEGTYIIASTIEIPAGKTLRGVNSSTVILQANTGINPIQIGTSSKLQNLTVTGDTNLVRRSGSGSGSFTVDSCTLTCTGDYAVYIYGNSDFFITNCTFDGTDGFSCDGFSYRGHLLNNKFVVSVNPLTLTISCYDFYIKGNSFTLAPSIYGTRHILTANHFFAVPTKINSTESIWSGNYPHPAANNDDGVDVLVVSLNKNLTPIDCAVEEVNGFGVLSFADTIITSAGILPYALTSALDPLRYYYIDLWWVCPDGFYGDVKWNITVTFRDQITGVIGTSVTKTFIDSRTGATTLAEDHFQIEVTDGYGLGANLPTHVSVIVERIGNDIADTLGTSAYLTELQLTLPRD